MKVRTKILLILSVVVVALSIGSIATINSQLQTKQPQDETKAKASDDAATPIVDFNVDKNISIEQDRASKNSRYDRQILVLQEPSKDVAEVSDEIHFAKGLSDLPFDKSDLVIVGTVEESAAYLSNDKTGIYSEFIIKVSQILKQPFDLSIKQGKSITTERFGGRVRYPSGKIVRYGIEGQGSPVKNQKYLLFLSRTEQNNFEIITGYQLQENKVFALDGTRINRLGKGRWVFDKHNGEDYDKFWQEVQNLAIQFQGGRNQ